MSCVRGREEILAFASSLASLCPPFLYPLVFAPSTIKHKGHFWRARPFLIDLQSRTRRRGSRPSPCETGPWCRENKEGRETREAPADCISLCVAIAAVEEGGISTWLLLGSSPASFLPQNFYPFPVLPSFPSPRNTNFFFFQTHIHSLHALHSSHLRLSRSLNTLISVARFPLSSCSSQLWIARSRLPAPSDSPVSTFLVLLVTALISPVKNNHHEGITLPRRFRRHPGCCHAR